MKSRRSSLTVALPQSMNQFLAQDVQFAVRFCVFPSGVLLLPHVCLSLVLFFTGNKDGNCQPTVQPRLLQVQALGFESYSSFCWVLLASVVGLSCILALVSHIENVNKHGLRRLLATRNVSTRWLSRADKTYTDEKYAMKHLGEGSVYYFFLKDSMAGLLIALANTAAQVYMVSHRALFS